MRKILCLLGCMILVLSPVACKRSEKEKAEDTSMGSTTTTLIAPAASMTTTSAPPSSDLVMPPTPMNDTVQPPGTMAPIPPEATVNPNAAAPPAAPGSGTGATDNTIMDQSTVPVVPSPVPAPSGTQQ